MRALCLISTDEWCEISSFLFFGYVMFARNYGETEYFARCKTDPLKLCDTTLINFELIFLIEELLP